jgi:hypothetical protein
LTSNNIFGFRKNGSGPICSESTGSNVNGFGVDGKGNLIVGAAYPSSEIQIYKGPAMCGPLFGTIPDPFGQAGDAAANDAINGKIVVSATSGGSSGVAVCKFSSKTCKFHKAPEMSSAAGVAMDKAGNCYADGFDTNSHVGLWYFGGCAKTGIELGPANGFNEPYYGGLSVDNQSNLVVVSLFNASFSTPSTVTVYSGCAKGTCNVVGGPFTLNGESAFGHLGAQNEQWVTTDITNSMVEVYAYTGHGTGLSFIYSFNNGLTCATNLCESAAFSPGSPNL